MNIICRTCQQAAALTDEHIALRALQRELNKVDAASLKNAVGRDGTPLRWRGALTDAPPQNNAATTERRNQADVHSFIMSAPGALMKRIEILRQSVI